VEERTERGRAFHVHAAADWKDGSPMVERILCVASSGQKTKQSEVAGEYVRRKRTECDSFVGSVRYGSADQANSAFHPSSPIDVAHASLINLETLTHFNTSQLPSPKLQHFLSRLLP